MLINSLCGRIAIADMPRGARNLNIFLYMPRFLRDVLERSRAFDHALLPKLVLFLCGNIGSITSPNNIGNVLSDECDIVNVKKNPVKESRERPWTGISIC